MHPDGSIKVKFHIYRSTSRDWLNQLEVENVQKTRQISLLKQIILQTTPSSARKSAANNTHSDTSNYAMNNGGNFSGNSGSVNIQTPIKLLF